MTNKSKWNSRTSHLSETSRSSMVWEIQTCFFYDKIKLVLLYPPVHPQLEKKQYFVDVLGFWIRPFLILLSPQTRQMALTEYRFEGLPATWGDSSTGPGAVPLGLYDPEDLTALELPGSGRIVFVTSEVLLN